MPTFLAADTHAPAPNALQRTWLLAALRAADGLLPVGVATRSLNVLRERGWITTAPARDDDAEFTRYKITPAGRFALLSLAKADALLSTLVSVEPGRIEAPVQERILNSLVREGLVINLTRRGQQAEGEEQHPYLTNLGRRLVGLPEVDDTPAGDYLLAALAANGLEAAVETDHKGDSRVVYRSGDVEALFYREVWNPGHYTYSALHPAWMHTKPWTAQITHDAGEALEKHLPNGLGVQEESARMAGAFAAWLADRDDAAFAA
ncbi:hypothetical protein KBZ94_38195 [Streptomyces sp. RM72]|uniref:hypothetical protein n=1 Tax=Streptomyces sp. RM72 TaxID=1115510 RepID=UPI001B381CED|nr:hypothetical protein [Streptomyces sp. RM72]MBQ0890685.1 hypothetical protein [Streptomyces sp. RM72]